MQINLTSTKLAPRHVMHFKTTTTKKISQKMVKGEWIKKLWYIDTMEYYSAIRKNKIMPLSATWIELETLTLRSKSERERQIPYGI